MQNKVKSGAVTSIRLTLEQRRQADQIRRAGKYKSRSAAIKAAIGIVARMAA